VSAAPNISPDQSITREIAIWIGWGKACLTVVVALFFLAAGEGQDPAGSAMAAGVVGFALVYLLLLVAPGLALAYKTRRFVLALVLLILPDALMLLWVIAL
jgi:hypothetical protein